jgi:hypothetical protein
MAMTTSVLPMKAKKKKKKKQKKKNKGNVKDKINAQVSTIGSHHRILLTFHTIDAFSL